VSNKRFQRAAEGSHWHQALGQPLKRHTLDAEKELIEPVGPLLALVALLGLVVVGFARLRHRRSELVEDVKFGAEFMEHLQVFFRSRGKDNAAYAWLTQNSLRMQRELGAFGWLTAYRRPFDSIVHNHAAVITTLLPELYGELNNVGYSGPNEIAVAQMQQTLQEVIIRHGGLLQERDQAIVRDLRNPVIWFREGVRAVVYLPVSLLTWLGLAPAASADRVSGSFLGRFLTGVIGVVTLVAALVTIAVGWDEFASKIAALWALIRV
jgi:hypothetical protein